MRGTGQHLDPGAATPTNVAPELRPRPGPIAILPFSKPIFEDAVRGAGGTVAPISADTRGIVWLSTGHADELVETLAANPGVQWVQLPWAGVDGFATVLSQFADKPFPLWTSAKGAYSEPVAEHALALTLALLRRFPEKSHGTSWEITKRGQSLYGLDVLIVGAGGIAKELIRLLSVFDVHITIVRRSSAPLDGAASTVTAAKFGSVLPHADVVIIAAASTDETARLIGAAELRLMKSSAVLVNVARGALIDTDALAEALSAGAITGAGLDVTDPEPLPDGHPLWNAACCLITSHAADTPEMTEPLLANRVRLNVEAFLDHGQFVGVVDPVAGY